MVYKYTQIYYCNEKFHDIERKGVSCLCYGPAHKIFRYLRTEFLILHYALSTCLFTELKSQSVQLLKSCNFLCITVPTAVVFSSLKLVPNIKKECSTANLLFCGVWGEFENKRKAVRRVWKILLKRSLVICTSSETELG